MRLTKRAETGLITIGVGLCVAGIVIAFAAFDNKVMGQIEKSDKFRARCNSVYGETYIGDTESLCYVNGKVVLSEK